MIMKKYLSRLALAAIICVPLAAHSVDAKRQAEVAKRSPDVMPFSLKAMTDFFTSTNNGGTQRVLAKDVSDAVQTRFVREHLREIQVKFLRGDFSGPSHIHGNDISGLAQLKAAQPGEISIKYKNVAGAQSSRIKRATSN